MKYSIFIDDQNIVMGRKVQMPMAEALDVVGSVEIDFFHAGRISHYENNYVIIPLFLSEILDMINDVIESRRGKIINWSLGMAPFAFVSKREERVLVSSSDDNFVNKIYDSTSIEEFQSLKTKVMSDIRRFGCV